MKIRRFINILGIALVLAMLFIALPVQPALATTTAIHISASQGQPGDTVTLHGTVSPPTSLQQAAAVYFSHNNLNVGADLATAATYMQLTTTLVTATTDDVANAGNFTMTFTVPSTIPAAVAPTDGGTTEEAVTTGTYYIYVVIVTTLSPTNTIIAAKASFTISSPTLDAPAPATGPVGTSVSLTGSGLPPSTALVFKFDTTTITATGSQSTGTGGAFASIITIPSAATVGAHTIYVTAGTTTVSQPFTVTAGTVAGASIALDPATGAAGTTGVLVTGAGFTASAAITLQFDTTVLTPTSGPNATLANGTCYNTITIPSTATAGAHVITVTVGATQATATFTVTGGSAPSGTLIVSSASGAVGTTITMHSNGFIANHAFTVTYDSVSTNTTGTVGADGLLFTNFTIPKSQHGAHTIVASDGTNSATAIYTIESVAPTTPQPLRPYMDEGVSSPASFDWADVTDPSAPVTYKLQIATANTFATDTILIDKSNILTSGYTLTDADNLKVTTGVTYYWREKAVDAAGNESAWTGANSFSISQGFSFSGWPLYVTIVIVAILLFVFGILVGRRSAYNY